MKQHHPLYRKLLDGMARYGATAEGAAEETLGVPAERIRKRVILAPWWEPHVFDPALFGAAELIADGEVRIWDVSAPDGRMFTYIKSHIGAPVCTDVALALGLTACETCLFIGSVGALDPVMHIGDIVVPEYSVCGDGASRYLLTGPLDASDPFGRRAYPDAGLQAALLGAALRVCTAEGVRFHVGHTFSIDTIFAQFSRIDEITSMGCDTIEMETAAAFRAAALAGYRMAALFSVSDNTLQNKSLAGGRTDDERAYRRQVRRTVFPQILLECMG